MIKYFSKWVSKQKIPDEYLESALSGLEAGHFEANLGGCLYKTDKSTSVDLTI